MGLIPSSEKKEKRVEEEFTAYHSDVFKNLKFVEYLHSREVYPEVIVISYLDTPKNKRLVDETYKKYLSSTRYKEKDLEYKTRGGFSP